MFTARTSAPALAQEADENLRNLRNLWIRSAGRDGCPLESEQGLAGDTEVSRSVRRTVAEGEYLRFAATRAGGGGG